MQKSLTLKPGKEEPLKRWHPWIFSGAIARAEGSPEDGDLVEIRNSKGQKLAVAHFQNGSIMARVLDFSADARPETVDFWVEKLQKALAARRAIGLLDDFERTDCFRLVHAEGDGLPGLIVDVYGKTAVVQCHSIGMHRQKDLIAEALRRVLGDRCASIFDKSSESLPPKFAASVKNSSLFGDALAGEVVENGCRFSINWADGQKTGFFLDQRDNRLALQDFVKGKTVLNAFCYTGGFSVYALKAGAVQVDSVDISKKAIELVEKNVALNGPFSGQHASWAEDVLQFLKNAPPEKYEVMVVDPPAYAKSLDKRHNAVQGYKRLNEMALRRIARGGVLLTFSCSQVVGDELFYKTVTSAAMEVGRSVRVIKRLSQGGDHPVSLFHPEGSYLKGLILLVE